MLVGCVVVFNSLCVGIVVFGCVVGCCVCVCGVLRVCLVIVVLFRCVGVVAVDVCVLFVSFI